MAILMMVLMLTDGSRQVVDLAITPSREVCEALAATLNDYPKKPADVHMMCRAAQVEDRS